MWWSRRLKRGFHVAQLEIIEVNRCLIWNIGLFVIHCHSITFPDAQNHGTGILKPTNIFYVSHSCREIFQSHDSAHLGLNRFISFAISVGKTFWARPHRGLVSPPGSSQLDHFSPCSKRKRTSSKKNISSSNFYQLLGIWDVFRGGGCIQINQILPN